MQPPDTERSIPEKGTLYVAPATARLRATPRLMATTQADLPARPQPTVANLALSAARVQERAAALVDHARTTGRGHSLRLWRLALQSALVDLAREASGLPTSAACRSFTWELRDETYHVMATFGPRTTVH